MTVDLSICVPTYNRSALLKESLTSLINQIRGSLINQIELIIVDNHSVDETSDVVNQLLLDNKNLNIRYIKREKNIGPDNVFLCTEYAIGNFVLIFSDDDILLENSLALIINCIMQNEDLKAITINTCPLSDEGHPIVEKKRFLKNKTIRDASESLLELSTYITFLSSVIYKRSLVDRSHIESFRGSQIIQSYAFAQSLNSTGSHHILADALIACRIGNSRYNWFYIFIVQMEDFFIEIDKFGLKNNLVIHLKQKHYFFSIIPHIMLCKSNKEMCYKYEFDTNFTKKFLREYYFRFNLLTFGILMLPSYIIRIFFSLLKSIKNKIKNTRKI